MFVDNLLTLKILSYSYLYLIISLIIFVPLLANLINSQYRKYNLLDIPNERKTHKYPTPISGGIIYLISILIVTIIIQFFFETDLSFYFNILFISSIYFFIGIFDDKKNPSTFFKTIIVLIPLIIITFFFENLVVNELRFKYLFQNTISLKFFAIPFTVFCVFMFFNALNYADGKNGVCISYVICIIIFLTTLSNQIKEFYYLNILILLIILYFNLKNKLFLGNNGVNFLSIFLSLIIIKTYNLNNFILYCDEIFLIMLIPGIDATRVTFQRIYKNISPVQPDKKHLHHYISVFVDEKFIWLVYSLLASSPIILLNYSKNFFFSISLPLIIYFFIVFKVSKK